MCAQPENVLLKSDSTNILGFVTKLSDFGLAKLLREVRARARLLCVRACACVAWGGEGGL